MSGLLCWPLLEWTKMPQFATAWTSGTLKRDLLASFAPVSGGIFALPEGLCTASSVFSLLEDECDRYLVSFVGSSFSTFECSLCGCINDVYQHTSQLAAEEINQSYISIRPVPALKKLWELSSTTASKDKLHVVLSEKEFKFFFGHRLPWLVQIPPPGHIQSQQSGSTGAPGTRPAQPGVYAEQHAPNQLQRADSSNSLASRPNISAPTSIPKNAAAMPNATRGPAPLPSIHAGRPNTMPPSASSSGSAQNGYISTYPTNHGHVGGPTTGPHAPAPAPATAPPPAQRSTQIKLVMKRTAT